MQIKRRNEDYEIRDQFAVKRLSILIHKLGIYNFPGERSYFSPEGLRLVTIIAYLERHYQYVMWP